LAKQGLIDNVVDVNEIAIRKAMFDMLLKEQMVLEGSAAIGVAALRTSNVQDRFYNKKVVIILTGANISEEDLIKIVKEYG